MSNKTRIYINLAVFVVVFGAMLVWASRNVVSLDRIEQPYDLVVEADAASGVSANAEVAYLGVHYGRVDSVEQLDGGVRINMKIDRDREIPVGSTPDGLTKELAANIALWQPIVKATAYKIEN